MSETDWKAVHRMENAAQRASNAAQQCEDAATRIAHLLEDGYGGNGLRLIEALEAYNAEHKQQRDELLALCRRIPNWVAGDWSDELRAAIARVSK